MAWLTVFEETIFLPQGRHFGRGASANARAERPAKTSVNFTTVFIISLVSPKACDILFLAIEESVFVSAANHSSILPGDGTPVTKSTEPFGFQNKTLFFRSLLQFSSVIMMKGR